MPIRVLVVDDSVFMRKLISNIISAEPDLSVVATAINGRDALKKLEEFPIDVVTLDVEMPFMDGLETLERIMATRPMPVVMLSSLTRQGSEITIKALALGAVDFITKPAGSISLDLTSISREIVKKIRLAAMAHFPPVDRITFLPKKEPPRALPPTVPGAAAKLVVIGASTGGPRAIEGIFSQIPPNLPAGILVVQHMPEHFTRRFAERLDSLFPFPVKEAENGDLIENGKVLIAPGDYHMVVGQDRRIYLNKDERVMFLRPSIDVTMACLPEIYGKSILGVILTGMGRDGAQGMAGIKSAGGITIAQDRASSTIYSMPKVVADQGNVDHVLPLKRIGESITKIVSIL